MLLEFRVKNFLSIKDEVCLDLKATSITDFGDINLIHTERHKVLKGAVIYGANSSGKSNLIKAMSTMRRIVSVSYTHLDVYKRQGLKVDSEENRLIPNTKSLKRSLERIEIKHISHFTFSVLRVNRNEVEEF